MIQNHGVFVGANDTSEIRHIYEDIFTKFESRIEQKIPVGEFDIPASITEIIPAIRMILSTEKLVTLRVRNNQLISHFASSREAAAKIRGPFTPDNIVYCKSQHLYCDAEGSATDVIAELKKQINEFTQEYSYTPRVILVKGMGLIAVGENAEGADTILDVFEDKMNISWLSESFGGPHFMTDEQIEFIDSWEVENYRRKITAEDGSSGRAADRVIIVTGGAKGFGEGIVRGLHAQGANILIADIDSELGEDLAESLNARGGKNQVRSFRTDVSDSKSLQDLMKETVKWFGGLDAFISNAGILHAGGLDEMDEETFDRVTRINYNAYFYGTKYASRIMKLQQDTGSASHYSDIIQINSKSGLSGSKKNFAYAGGKFGGIGLTQSFALELAPHKIKVNSVCPGNFFEGPLWSDPDTGLFVQYLNTGKVPGAKNIEEVRAHYEKQVPLGRGCRVEDVLKAIFYIMEQEYETGQAIPVTGGQIMLS
ncbi:SDR family NAD(P)-dependent oxidoreductase [Bacteroidota bacterium]